MSEWLKEHAWKVCIPLKGIEGSNPSLSAIRGELADKVIKQMFLEPSPQLSTKVLSIISFNNNY